MFPDLFAMALLYLQFRPEIVLCRCSVVFPLKNLNVKNCLKLDVMILSSNTYIYAIQHIF